MLFSPENAYYTVYAYTMLYYIGLALLVESVTNQTTVHGQTDHSQRISRRSRCLVKHSWKAVNGSREGLGNGRSFPLNLPQKVSLSNELVFSALSAQFSFYTPADCIDDSARPLPK